MCKPRCERPSKRIVRGVQRRYNWRIGPTAKALCIPFIALGVSLAPLEAQVSKTLDLSTTYGLKTFYVVFASRGGSATGHAFVVWGVEDGVRRKSTVRALGLYPEGEGTNCSSVVRTVPGRVMDELINHSVQGITQQLIVRVDESYFNRSWKVGRAWDCKHEFSLFSRDCVEFLRAVGDSLGLEMPRRFVTRWTPQAYVRALLASVGDGSVELGYGEYQGSLMHDQPLGHGVLIYRDGSRIEGAFRGLDHYLGSGRLNGIEGGYSYEGEIADGQPQGTGTVWSGTAEKVLMGTFEGGVLRKVTRDFTVDRAYSGRRRTLGLAFTKSADTGKDSSR